MTNPARIRSEEQSGGAAAASSGSEEQRRSGVVPAPVPTPVPVHVPLGLTRKQGQEATFPFGQVRSHYGPKWLRA